MLETKLVVRLLDSHDRLLGWAEVAGRAHGDGIIWVEMQTVVPVDVAGTPAFLSVHWCDVNVEIRSAIDKHKVVQGDVITLPGNWAAITCGPAAGGLPPVTVRSRQMIEMPVGQLGARAN